MKYLKKIFSLLIVFLFIFGVFLIAQLSSKKLNSFVTTQTITNAIVAFFGAFFAFSFVKLGEIINRKRKRNVEHINAVIKFQHIFNKSINSLQQNKIFLENNIKALVAKRILTLSFFDLPIHDELVQELKNIDFMNEVYAIFRDYEAVNLDLQTLTSFYNEVKNFFFEKKISTKDFVFNVNECIERMSKLSDYLKQLRIKSIRLFAISRILAREDKSWNLFYGPHIGKHYIKNLDKFLQPIMIEVEKEFQVDNAKKLWSAHAKTQIKEQLEHKLDNVKVCALSAFNSRFAASELLLLAPNWASANFANSRNVMRQWIGKEFTYV